MAAVLSESESARPLHSSDSDVDLEADHDVDTAACRSRSSGALLLVAVTACAGTLLGLRAWGNNRSVAAAAFRRVAEAGRVAIVNGDVAAELIAASSDSQDCSLSCRKDFWSEDAAIENSDYQECCRWCPGSKCKFPCSETCYQNTVGYFFCSDGDVACRGLVERKHDECCQQCPGEVCVDQSLSVATPV